MLAQGWIFEEGDKNMAQNELWEFEHPITVTATLPTNITWRPTTFGSEDHGNFTLNLWLLRTDSTSDQVVSDYLPALLFGKISSPKRGLQFLFFNQ